jgi:hypothetical protein
LAFIFKELWYNTSTMTEFNEKGLGDWKSSLSAEERARLEKAGRITSNPIGLRNERGEKGTPLSPEDFMLVQNNFHLIFYKDDGKELNIGRMWRQKKAFQQWLADKPEEAQKFVDELVAGAKFG